MIQACSENPTSETVPVIIDLRAQLIAEGKCICCMRNPASHMPRGSSDRIWCRDCFIRIVQADVVAYRGLQQEINDALGLVTHGSTETGIPKAPSTDIEAEPEDQRPEQDEPVYRQYTTGMFDPKIAAWDPEPPPVDRCSMCEKDFSESNPIGFVEPRQTGFRGATELWPWCGPCWTSNRKYGVYAN